MVSLCYKQMEKPPFKQTPVCGAWIMRERLGTGGFGHVYLYQHQVCHFNLMSVFVLTVPFSFEH